jgi:hypothetical protein
MNVDSTGYGGATLTLYEGTQPANADAALGSQTTIATFTLPAATSNTVSSAGVITYGAIAAATAAASSTPGSTTLWYRITRASDSAVLSDGNAGLEAAAKDMVLDSTTIISGASVTITGATRTVTK